MTAAKLDIGGVITSTFGVLGRNLGPFLALAALLVGVPMALSGLGLAELNSSGRGPPAILGNYSMGLIGGLISMVFTAVLQGSLIHGTVVDLNGGRASFGECLATGLRNFFPVILVSILMWLGIAVGLLLFIVPGVMIGLAWCVSAPARVSEQCDVVEALGRSAELTRGSRWRVLTLMILYMVLTWIVSAVAGWLTLTALSAPMASHTIIPIVVAGAGSAVNSVVGATGLSVLYVELRRLREGVTPDALAALFD